MSLVKDPVSRAERVSTPHQARALRDDLEAELALNANVPPEWSDEADRALSILRSNYSEDEMDDANASELGLSRGASSGLGDNSSSPSSGGGERAPSRRAGARPRSGGQRRSRARSNGIGLPAFRAGRYLEQTGLPGAGRSGTAAALRFVGAAVGLSLLYLVLTRASAGPRGGSAVELALGSTLGVLERVIAPVDPLRPPPSRKPATKRRPATATRK